MNPEKRIVDIAIENGATLAGIAGMDALKTSFSHAVYTKMGNYAGSGIIEENDTLQNDQLFNWPASAKSVIVIGLSHPEEQPELDWWDGGGTSGNRRMIDILERTRQQIKKDLKVDSHKLHYYVEKGGVFLKDAAVLAGLGCIGKSNLLVTPAYGPRIRLRALLLDVELHPTGPVEFDPCADCKAYCRRVCPESAMDGKASLFRDMDDAVALPARDGCFDRKICNIRMKRDVSESAKDSCGDPAPVRFCRRCEFACPVGKPRRRQKAI